MNSLHCVSVFSFGKKPTLSYSSQLTYDVNGESGKLSELKLSLHVIFVPLLLGCPICSPQHKLISLHSEGKSALTPDT